MKKTSIIALIALPLAGLVSCSDKEATPAKAEAKALNTAEDYMNAMVDCMNEFASIIDATTAENSADQAKKITALVNKMQKLSKEVEAKVDKFVNIQRAGNLESITEEEQQEYNELITVLK